MMVGFGLALTMSVQGQLKKFYSLHEVSNFDTVNFTLSATSGHCYFRSIGGGNPLNIYGNPDLEKINPSFDASVIRSTCNVKLDLEEFRTSGLGDGFAFAMLGNSAKEEEANYWKMLVNDDKIYRLDLSYGIGSSDIDLSGTSVKNLKICTGSADVQVNYNEDDPNKIEMDTFMVKVDLGSLAAKDLNNSNAKCVIAEIGFGKAVLDFSTPMNNKCDVKAMVGAGNLDIHLPKDAPIIIYMKESPLCGLKMIKGFEEVEKNVYVNMSYSAEAENLLTFDIDVVLGSVAFTYAD